MKKILFLMLLLVSMTTQSRPGLLDSLGLTNDYDTPPPVEQAFQFSATINDEKSLSVQWQIAEGNYLYKDKIRFELADSDGVSLLPISLPVGENKVDEIFGLSEVYTHDTSVTLPLKRDNPGSRSITLIAHYQGCSETFHICYPPTQSTIELLLPTITADETEAVSTVSKSDVANTFSQQDRIAKSLSEDSLAKILFGFLGLGLLLAFTPCVFPMIPILSSIIVGEGERITTHRAFILSLSYVVAMSVTYTAAGVITGLVGENLQAMFQNPWIIGSFSGLFVILALSMFGLFELQLPHALQHRLHHISHQQQGGHVIGAATMGLLSGLIVGPCLAPPLAGALIFIGQQGDPVLGGMALFALSMGMGLPLLIIGTSAGSLLPKAGDWMITIKTVFGVVMLALAVWMLERILPASIIMLLWGSLIIGMAIFLGALNSLHIDSGGWEKCWKSTGIILLIYGSLLIIGAASGGHNVWQPLDTFTLKSANADKAPSGIQFKRVSDLAELDHALSNTQTVSMLDLYADWCVECKRMEVTTFKDPLLIDALSNISALQVDMTENNDNHKALLKHFGLFGPPTLLFFDNKRHEYRHHRLIGLISAGELINHIANLPPSAP
ncbi:MAG: protein-disulfide reductase DsbD [Gammaproteobacteria bacterium]|nr:protein-disulfide reductase DsbD [Gammaproteobacteria bacterium]